MKSTLACIALLITPFCLWTVSAQAQTGFTLSNQPASNLPAAPPALKVLYITGGGYHDYEKLTPIITDGIKKHAHADIDVKMQKNADGKWNLDCMRDKNLGEGYDAIIYNICFAGDEKANTLPPEADQDLIDNALRVTKEGKPTLMLHCSMHTFMASDDWTDCCGQRTRHHDKYKPFATEKVTADHPIMKHFPDNWSTPGDELYETLVFPDSSTPLLRSTTPDNNGKQSIVCWVHTYGKGPVFGTTLGHDTKTVEQDAYLRLLADGLLWACGKLDADGNPAPGYGPAN
ncbi:MAG TPA: ThuA domain-containing protein [Pirellulales bacterium]|nr:ThuA domain-containing protein [Pirellulales bacterium]